MPFLSALADKPLLLGMVLIVLTAALVAAGIPGVILPLSFSSGMLLGNWLGMAVVVLGALVGSHAFFAATRRWFAGHVRLRWGERLKRFDRQLEDHGFFYVLGLRLMGVPHFLVNAASALSPIRARSFALATMLGFIPAVALAATAGSAI